MGSPPLHLAYVVVCQVAAVNLEGSPRPGFIEAMAGSAQVERLSRANFLPYGGNHFRAPGPGRSAERSERRGVY
jgi:hypothetical protein